MSNKAFETTMEPETKQPEPLVRDDVAYVLPMATFLAFIWLGTKGVETGYGNAWYPWTYAARAVVVGGMLILFRHAYTKIRWDYWWLGVIVGVVGIVQWIGMQLFLQEHFAFFKPGEKVFDPDRFFASPGARYAFIGVRLVGAAVVVPFMEELFWRDYAWRSIVAPNDFKPGEKVFDPDRFFASPGARYAFIGVRLVGAAVVVPFMEELFWRSARERF